MELYRDHRTTGKGCGDTVSKICKTLTESRYEVAISPISVTMNSEEAVENLDIIMGAIPEVLQLKRGAYAKVGASVPERTVFAATLSSLLPSDFTESNGRPSRFGASNFANMVLTVLLQNTGEVIGRDGAVPNILGATAACACGGISNHGGDPSLRFHS